MNSPSFPRIAASSLLAMGLLVVLLPVRARAAAGDIDPAFNPNANGAVYCAAQQPDGKVVIGGLFTTVGGVTRNRIARVNADGTLDSAFNPNVDNTVFAIAVQPDGKIVIGGIFSTVGGVQRIRLARLNADGTLETGFNPTADGQVLNIQLLTNGQIVISGAFITVGGFSAPHICRLNANGSFDQFWGPNVNNTVFSTAIQADGKIIITGNFTAVNGATHQGIARLNADGGPDSSFNGSVSTNTGNIALTTAVQPDGKIIVGGSYLIANGSTVNHLARFNTDGSTDLTYVPNVDARVWTVALQTDGKLVVGGDFLNSFTSSSTTTPRNYLARFNADATLDSAWNPSPNATVNCTAGQPDGKTLVGGAFGGIASAGRANIARLLNDAATSAVTVPSATRLQWLRGGATPEVQQVYFETSVNGGATWTFLGDATRISGGWELTGGTLPASGQARGCARVVSGQYNSSSGLIATAGVAFGPFTAPEIAVEQPAGTNLNTGSTATLGTAPVGTSADYMLVVKNTGQQTLLLSGSPVVALNGANASEFSVLAQPAGSIPGGGQSTFIVRFTPATAGAKVATLSIPNNDTTGSENPFTLTLNATGLTAGVTGGWVNGGNFTVGTVGSTPNTNTWPAAQSPDKAVDATLLTKFLLFKTTNAAIGIMPVNTALKYNQLTLTTAEDAVERDPASYEIYGSTSALPTTAGTNVALSGLTLIASGPLSLPAARNVATTIPFANTTAYTAYLIVFPTVKNTTPANSTQISEVALSFSDTTGPTGGTLSVSPTAANPGATLTIYMLGWSDPSTPLSYAVLIDGTVVSPQDQPALRTVPAPATPGVHTLTGRIYDALNNFTDVTQNFTVNAALESWRQQYFGTTSNSGDAANTFDFDGDGLVNLVEFAFGLNPTIPSNAQLPQAQLSGGNLTYTFSTPAGVSGITYGAEYSTTLAADDWHDIPDTGVAPQHIFSVPQGENTKLFIRLTVTL